MQPRRSYIGLLVASSDACPNMVPTIIVEGSSHGAARSVVCWPAEVHLRRQRVRDITVTGKVNMVWTRRCHTEPLPTPPRRGWPAPRLNTTFAEELRRAALQARAMLDDLDSELPTVLALVDWTDAD